jgi:hypothetical protein
MGYSPDSNDVSTEAEESPLLRSVTGKQAECEGLLYAVVICRVSSVVVTCSYDL